MNSLKHIWVKFLIGLFLFINASTNMASAQFAGNLWGQVAISDSISFINGDIVMKPAGELFLGTHSPQGLQGLHTNTLNIIGNYVGDEGSKIYVSIADNSNASGTRDYINITGTATKNGAGTLIVPDYYANWDGSCIDLISADNTASDVETFRMDEINVNNRIAVLRSREENNNTVWFLGERLALSQYTPEQTYCSGDFGSLESLSVTMSESDGYSYQWYSCNYDGSNAVNLGSVNGAQTANYTPPLGKAGTYYYYCVVTSKRCSYNTDTTAISGAITISPNVISQKMNSTLVINNNNETNGGYNFVYYTWYKDGEKIAEGRHDNLFGHYYAGGNLDPNAEYWVELIDINGNHYRTCSFTPTIKTEANFIVYPNPVSIASNNSITVKIDGVSQEELNLASIDVYNILGLHIAREDVRGRSLVSVPVPHVAGTYVLRFKSKTVERKIKVIVE